MNRTIFTGFILFFAFYFFNSTAGFAQITSGADAIVPTEYSGGNQDNIHVFCGQKDVPNGSLTATFAGGESGTIEWTKYNATAATFDFFSSDLSGTTSSTISNLADGCYRAKLTSASGVKIYTAWVFNDYITATAEIPESDCTSFTLKGTFDSPNFTYTDLTTGQSIVLNKDIQVKWMNGDALVNKVLTSTIYDPPTKDTQYSLEVSDRFSCVGKASVTYISIVTKAVFSVSPDKGEAPLEVTFNNESENGDGGKFQWFIFKDLDKIKQEAAKNPGKVIDSILVVLYNDKPVFTFESSGTYRVKLVSTKMSEKHTCYDTTYLAGYIVADTSFIDAPNVFTPNGDGVNDAFIVKFWSMKSLKISIFNRWGKLLHVWESGNVENYGNTIKSVPQSVWDGKVGGKMATPGVYYYVVDGIGRDDKRRRTSGFFHLFRDK